MVSLGETVGARRDYRTPGVLQRRKERTMPEAGNLVESRRTEERSRDAAAGAGRRSPTVYHIPVCPFSQRLEILLTLKGCGDLVDFHVVDITRPRPNWLLEKTRGTTALPVLETEDGAIINE